MGQGGLAIRTLRNQSGTNGSRTLGSILVGGSSGSGAGSVRRMYGWYVKNNSQDQFYNTVFNLNYGKFRSHTEWCLNRNV